MRRQAYLAPYLRRRQPQDRTDSLRTALRMEVFGASCYVLVQRGAPRLVLEAARTRRELASSVVLRPSGRRLRSWAKRFGAMCRGGRPSRKGES